jgi:Protein of unknown function (DUF2911)
MKLISKIIPLFLMFTTLIFAQSKPASPAESVVGKIGNANVTIKYGSPSVKGREIWGGLVPFDKVWRAGANNATTFETDQNIKIEGKELPKGKYSFFVIPNATSTTLIFNKVQEQWGAYKYEESRDQLRVIVKPQVVENTAEKLEYKITENKVYLNWEKWSIGFEVK